MSSRRNPFDELERLFEGMNKNLAPFEPSFDHGVPIDVVSTDDQYVVTADLPGYEKDDIDVRLSGDTLTVGAERETEREEESSEYVRRERSAERVSRTVRLPEPVDEESTSAAYNNGVLTVTLQKTAPDQGGHSIEVE